MPVVSSFFGIVVRIYYKEHGVPHFHAEHQGRYASFTFDGRPLAGDLYSRTASRLVRQWSVAHRFELDANWRRAQRGEPLEKIAPLS